MQGSLAVISAAQDAGFPSHALEIRQPQDGSNSIGIALILHARKLGR